MNHAKFRTVEFRCAGCAESCYICNPDVDDGSVYLCPICGDPLQRADTKLRLIPEDVWYAMKGVEYRNRGKKARALHGKVSKLVCYKRGCVRQ